MAFSGGTFSRTFDCTTDRDNGVKILASKFDTELDGFATGLSTCILKDGTQTCTAAIPFAEGLTVPDNKTIVLGSNSDITIQYDESTNDSLEIAANVEGAALGIVLKADQGDDNADQHKLNIADGGVLTLQSKISGGFVTYLTHTPNATVADSTTAVAGNLTVGGDLTLGSGAVISEAELEAIDGVTAGTVAASKAVIVDSNKDIASFRNVTLTGELDAGSLDISGDADIDGTLEADAMTLNGTAITATATLDTGISNNNVPKFTSGVADDDFLRVAGTSIEGRSASEVLSDIGAAPAAGSSNIVTTGALNSGSITSGFGSIDNGSSAITTTGVITGGTLEATADTSAGDNAAIGYTAAEGLILTGQGSTSDVVIKNDADTTVCFVPTGTDDLKFNDDAALIFGTGDDFKISHNGSKTKIEDTGTGNLEIRGTNIEFYSGDGGETLAKLTDDGAAELYHNNTKRIETTSAGVSVTAGAAATPGYAFTTDTSSGMFSPGADTLAFSSGGSERIRIDSSGRVGIGTSSNSSGVQFQTSGSARVEGTFFGADGSSSAPSIRFFNAASGIYHPGSDHLGFVASGSETFRIDASGNLLVGKTATGAEIVGCVLSTSGFATITRDGANPVFINRETNDGGLVELRQDNTTEGSITVSGGTVSFNGGHLSRWSRLIDASRPDTLVKGTVMSNLDEMIVWSHDEVLWTENDELPDGVSVGDVRTAEYTEDNEQLNHTKISDTEADINVAGVFVAWDDDDDDFEDFYLAMTGDMVIRIAQGTTVARGDLLMSAGDGTAKPQGDDIVRSRTIAKVISTTVSHTYDDGSYLVPCVLMAC